MNNNVKIPFVDLNKQYLTIKREIDEAMKNVLSNASFIGGKYVQKFEEEFAGYLGIKYCIGCANGTDALELLLRACNIKDGDEVIIPSHTWISTAEAVSNVGAAPVFVDTLSDSYNINPSLIEEKISEFTKAIIPVHLYGLPADMDKIMSIAKKYSLCVLEDCAQAHGAMYNRKKVGSIGDAGAFSFFPSKNLGCYGDGGCIVTNNEEIAQKVRMARNHGQLQKHNHLIIGRNSRLDAIQAAILSVKLPFLDHWNDKRRAHAQVYFEYLKDLDAGLSGMGVQANHVYHVFAIKTAQRTHLRNRLNDNGIETNIHYPQILPLTNVYKEIDAESKYPISYSYQAKILSLPMYPELEREDIDRIVQLIKSALIIK
jgi:dTDP-4-amino-4,6-dideoxygalactose transaminase